MNNKKLSPQTIKLMKDTLTSIYWYKASLLNFIKYSMEDGPLLLKYIDENSTKREIASSFIDKLVLNQTKYQNDIIYIIDNLCSHNNFSELEKAEKIEQIKEAKRNISELKNISKSFFDIKIAKEKEEEAKKRYSENQKSKQYFKDELEKIKNQYIECLSLDNKSKGYIFEQILYKLNNLFDLDPKASFKIQGEQIDGAFSLKNQEFILEVKLCKEPIDHTHIVIFIEKVRTKLENTLGLLLSNSGFTASAIEKANHQNILLMDGQDLFFVLDDRINYIELLEDKRKFASRTGNSYRKAIDILGNLQ